jgi:2-dehydropantoate 2-reductase
MLGFLVPALHPVIAMADAAQQRIVIAGAGSVGCYLGGCLALAGGNVTLLMRGDLAARIAERGFTVSSLDRFDHHVAAAAVGLETEPAAALAGADLVLVTVKCGAADQMAALIARHAPGRASVVALQNGVRGAETLAAHIGGESRIFAGTVTFNVVQSRPEHGPARFHRATSGSVIIPAAAARRTGLRAVPGLGIVGEGDITGVLWSKLVLNMNNALNALSGLPLVVELGDRRWRELLADHIDEALAILRPAGIRTRPIEGVNPRLIPFGLRLPSPLFRLVARRMLAIDPEARSSMWEDLVRGRPTEIDHLQGAVIELARAHNRSAPIAERVRDLVRELEGKPDAWPSIRPEQIAGRAV